MRRLLISVLFLLMCGILPAFSQMSMTGCSLGNNSSGVPLQTVMSFTFTEPLDINARWNNPEVPLAVFAGPDGDQVGYGTVTFSDDNRTINIPLTLQPNSTYCWLISNARATNGDTLDQPFDMGFTTAPERGPRAIGGAVTWPGHSPIGLEVGLFDASPDNDNRHLLYAQTVTNERGNYYLFGIQPGTYWLSAAFDVNHNGELDDNEPRADFDGNSDGRADSLVFADADMWGYGFLINTLSVPGNSVVLPQTVALEQNYPNPFNPTTDIRFSLPATQNVHLSVFDVLGREIAVLANGRMSAGDHTVTFNGASVPSGIYFYRLQAGEARFTKKMMLVK